MSRRLVHFSCGAASAVAAKLTLAQHADVAIVNAYIKEEHEDNDRFRSDCEKWFGVPITILRDEKYGASTLEVWRRRRYMLGVGRGFAPCSMELKQNLLKAVSFPDDIHVMGYTCEEMDRFNRLEASGLRIEAPLIDQNLSKADCLAMVERAGIELPMMYRLGFNNNNCIGCPKGGLGYWNKIRDDFPEQFARISAIQEAIGEGAYFLRDNRTAGRDRVALKDLDPTVGRHTEPEISCSFFCDAAEDLIAGTEAGRG